MRSRKSLRNDLQPDRTDDQHSNRIRPVPEGEFPAWNAVATLKHQGGAGQGI